jgi:hypothetical protein
MQPVLDRAWSDLRYHDRIWNAKRLPWRIRDRLLQLHRDGILNHGDLFIQTLRTLNNSGLDEHQGLQLLGSFAQQVAAATAQQQTTIRPYAVWKNELLLSLLHQQVGRPRGTCSTRG